MGIEKIRFLYLSMSADQACWSPFRQAATRRSSDQDALPSRCIFGAAVTGFRLFPPLWVQCAGRADRRSKGCNDLGPQDESYQPAPLHRPEHWAWQEK